MTKWLARLSPQSIPEYSIITEKVILSFDKKLNNFIARKLEET